MEDKISIIIPTYNRSILLKRAIESVLHQTYNNWELIIVDDGSTDDTKKTVDTFLNDERVIYKYQKNSGGNSSPKNLGLRIATGEYVTFLDSDDEYLPEKIEKQINLFKESSIKNLGFVGCNNFRINDNKITEDKLKHKGSIYKKILNKYFLSTPGLIMIKKEIINTVGTFDENIKFSNDTDFFIRIAKYDYGFDFVDESLLKYYEHKNSLTNTFKEESKLHELSYIYEKNVTDIDSECLAFLGMEAFKKNNYGKSRKYFLKSFMSDKTNMKSLLKFLLSTGIIRIKILKFIIRTKKI